MSDERKKIDDSQVLVMMIVDKNVEQNFVTSLKQNISDAKYCWIQKPICTGIAIYPAKTIDELFAELENSELQYVAILQDSYLADIPNIHAAVQKYEAEYRSEKRLLTRRIKLEDKKMEFEPTDDFDLGHDFVLGKREDVLAILHDKQNGKHSIVNNS